MYKFFTFIFLLQALVVVVIGSDISIVSKTFGTSEIDIGDFLAFEATLFTIKFDRDIYLNGETSVSNLSLNYLPDQQQQQQSTPDSTGSANREGNGGDDMPLAMTLQMGASILTCPCLDNCTEYLGCNSVECQWYSLPSMNPEDQNEGAPNFVIPFPAVENPIFAVFSIFSGEQNLQVTPSPNTLILTKITRNYNDYTKEWVQYTPPDMDFSTCTLSFTDSLDSITGAYYTFEDNNSTQTALKPLTITNFAVAADVCDYSKVISIVQDLFNDIDTLDTLDGKDSFERATWQLAAHLSRDTWLSCRTLIEDMLNYNYINVSIPGDRNCHFDYMSNDWLIDPCCNYELQFEQCCLPKTSIIEEEAPSSIDQSIVSSYCQNPDLASVILDQYIDTIRNSERCDSQIQSQGYDFEIWETLTRFVQTCQEEIYGSFNGEPPSCRVNDDCYTSCDTQSSSCVIPYDNPEPYLLECYIDNINPELERYLRLKWELTGSSTQNEFEIAFRTNMQDLGCIGRDSWMFQDRWEWQPVNNCSSFNNDHDCFCYDSSKIPTMNEGTNVTESENDHIECYGIVHTQFGESECLSSQSCNWANYIEDEGLCLNSTSTSHFCGECHGSECWERSIPSMCFNWVSDPSECTLRNGIQGPWGIQHCIYPDLNNEQDCTPSDKCPAPYMDQNSERWCPSYCYSNASTTHEECLQVQDENNNVWIYWDTDLEVNSGQNFTDYCFILYSQDQSDCNNLDLNFTTFGLYWDEGRSKCIIEANDAISETDCTDKTDFESDTPFIPVWSNDAIGICQINSKWTPLGCTTSGFEWFEGKQFQLGQFDTIEKCELGVCSIDMRLDQNQCENQGSCNLPCPKCRPLDWENTICFTSDYDETECNNEGGNWNSGFTICEFDFINDRITCESLTTSNHTFEFNDCRDLTLNQCSTCENDPGSCIIRQDILQCYTNRWDSCDDQTECEAQGVCNDWELENWNNQNCQGSSENLRSEGCTGVCIFPFDFSNGYPECDYGLESQNSRPKGWSKIGCIDYNFFGSNDCQTNNGTWTSRATTSQECSNQGYGCYERRIWSQTPKNLTVCTECGGEYSPLYNWKSGNWITGQMIPLNWKERQFESINSWNLTLNHTKFQREIEQVVGLMMIKRIQSQFYCKYGPLARLTEILACDCGDIKGSNCFVGIEDVPLANIDLFSGLATSTEISNVRITTDENTIADDHDTLSLSSVSTAVMASNEILNPQGKRSLHSSINGRTRYEHSTVDGTVHMIDKTPLDPTIYETLIRNDGLIVVGQLVSEVCTNITVPTNLTAPIFLCLETDDNIPLGSPFYVEPDFVKFNLFTLIGTPQEFNIVIDDNFFCANITFSGLFCPILRINETLFDWTTVDLDICGVYNGDNTTCDDCLGVPGGNNTLDECGVCNGDDSTCLDCLGVPNGGAVFDQCGVCDGNDSTCKDCLGVVNGTTFNDECEICGGDNSTCADCAGIPNGSTPVDICGVCNGTGQCTDCFGIPFGIAELDACNVCNGTNSTCLDCFQTPNGPFELDECGVCNGTNSTCLDCNNVPNGCDVIDACGVCGGDDSSCEDCNCVPNGGAVLDACLVCGGDNSTCIGCDGIPQIPFVVRDVCGICGGGDFTGITCNETVDPFCVNVSCSANGLCRPNVGICDCFTGFQGDECDEPIPCFEVSCGVHGECEEITGDCICAPGFSGEFCNVEDPCFDINCGANGDCSGGDCVCDTGFTGCRCEEIECGVNGFYSPVDNECQCIAGFTGTLCDECQVDSLDGKTFICIPLDEFFSNGKLIAVADASVDTIFALFPLAFTLDDVAANGFNCACERLDTLEPISVGTNPDQCVRRVETLNERAHVQIERLFDEPCDCGTLLLDLPDIVSTASDGSSNTLRILFIVLMILLGIIIILALAIMGYLSYYNNSTGSATVTSTISSTTSSSKAPSSSSSSNRNSRTISNYSSTKYKSTKNHNKKRKGHEIPRGTLVQRSGGIPLIILDN